MKKLFFMASCLLVLGNSPVLAQGDKPNVIVVRTIESGLFLEVYTARGSAKAERQKFKFKLGTSGDEAAQKYQQIIASYVEQGYVLQNMSNATPNTPYSTFVFIKAAKP